MSTGQEAEDDDDDEYEYVEMDMLTEPDFSGSEWAVGTVGTAADVKKQKVTETWVRLAVNDKGEKLAIWGDKAQGTWNFDVASQFLSMSKSQLWGKDIWAGVVDDYYYTQGSVRGWSFVTAAEVVGQWQARRLGVDPEEAGIAPWNLPPTETLQEAEETEPVAAEQEVSQLEEGEEASM
jgi:hypothetical protein